MSEFLKILFDEEDLVTSGNMYATIVMRQYQAKGPFISINSLKEKRLDSNVTKFRNFLVELDTPGMTIEAQLELCKGLPYSTAVYSGSKSVHFITSLVKPLATEKQWRQWANALIKSIPGADPATKNPSRFSRLPGVIRSDTNREQKLLEIRTRVPNNIVEAYVKPFITVESNFRALYSDLRGLKGVAALHPMSRAFLAGTHPCTAGRNNALYKTAADMAQAGTPLHEIEVSLLPPSLALGLSEQEITRTIKSAYQKAGQ